MTDMALLFAAYIIGSFPTAYLCAKALRKMDIRHAGTGNVGAANAYRSMGLLPGLITLGIDIFKGALAVGIAQRYGYAQGLAVLAAVLVIFAHNFNVFLGFKGGKGLASLVGILIILAPATIPVVFLFLFVLVRLLGDKNIAAGLAAMTIPFLLWVQHGQWQSAVSGGLILAPVLIKYVGDFRVFFGRRRDHV